MQICTKKGLSSLITCYLLHSVESLSSSVGGTDRLTFLADSLKSIATATTSLATDSTNISQSVQSSSSLISLGDKNQEQATPINEKTLKFSALEALLEKKAVLTWENSPPDLSSSSIWKKYRYNTSTLSNDKSISPSLPLSSSSAYPNWIEGYWATKFQFKGVSFPQGRQILSLRAPGAGLGTCLSLPNIGYNPSSFAQHYIISSSSEINNYCFEDLAYNIPRKFESFWPQSKVLSVQVQSRTETLTPKCFVTGDGCTIEENPYLHFPSNRIAFDFEGPTRSGGKQVQTCDATIISSLDETEEQEVKAQRTKKFISCKRYSQFNVNQELQLFYKEIVSVEKTSNGIEGNERSPIDGTIRVAAFLPQYIRNQDNTIPANKVYDDNTAVAQYDYKFRMEPIDESEAASM